MNSENLEVASFEPQNLFFAVTFTRPGDCSLDLLTRDYNTYAIYRGVYGFKGWGSNRKWYASYEMINDFALIIFQLDQLDKLDKYSEMVYDALTAALLQANQKDVARQNDELVESKYGIELLRRRK